MKNLGETVNKQQAYDVVAYVLKQESRRVIRTLTAEERRERQKEITAAINALKELNPETVEAEQPSLF